MILSFSDLSEKITESIEGTGYFKMTNQFNGDVIFCNAEIARLGESRSAFHDSRLTVYEDFQEVSFHEYLSNKCKYI